MSKRQRGGKDTTGSTRTVFLDGFNLVRLPDGTKATLLIYEVDGGMEVQDCPTESLVTWKGQEYMRSLDENGEIIPAAALATYQKHF